MTAGSPTRRDPPSAVGSAAVLLACFLIVFGPSFAAVTPRAMLVAVIGVAAGVVVVIGVAVALGRVPPNRADRDRTFRRVEIPGVGVVEYRLRRS